MIFTDGEARRAIADAVNAAGIPGVTAYPVAPATISPGDCWAAWQRDDWQTPNLATATYAVYVALTNADLSSTVEGLDPARTLIPDAINGIPLAAVLSSESVQMAVSDAPGGMPAVMFTVQYG